MLRLCPLAHRRQHTAESQLRQFHENKLLLCWHAFPRACRVQLKTVRLFLMEFCWEKICFAQVSLVELRWMQLCSADLSLVELRSMQFCLADLSLVELCWGKLCSAE